MERFLVVILLLANFSLSVIAPSVAFMMDNNHDYELKIYAESAEEEPCSDSEENISQEDIYLSDSFQFLVCSEYNYQLFFTQNASQMNEKHHDIFLPPPERV